MGYQIKITVENGKVVENNDRIREIFNSLENGQYIFSIDAINPLLNTRDYQNAYFAMVDTCVQHTGNSRYVIHNEFKKEQKVETTSDFDIIQWKTFLNQFRWWAYNEFDCIV